MAALSHGLAGADEGLRPYIVVGDAIPESLTGVPGDPARLSSPSLPMRQELHDKERQVVRAREWLAARKMRCVER